MFVFRCLPRPKGRRRAGRVQHRVLHGLLRPELGAGKHTAWDAVVLSFSDGVSYLSFGIFDHL